MRIRPLFLSFLLGVMVGVLILALVGVYRAAKLDPRLRYLRLQTLKTNETLGVGIYDAQCRGPLWTRFAFDKDGSMIDTLFCKPMAVVDYSMRTNLPPRLCVTFYHNGKSTLWVYLGGDSFARRVLYDESGKPESEEIWYEGSWRRLERREGKRCILLNGEWRPVLRFCRTNWVWIIGNGTDDSREDETGD